MTPSQFKPRWSLRTSLILLTLICLFFSRFIYVHNWIRTSRAFFTDVSYASESPTVEMIEDVVANRTAGSRQRIRVARIVRASKHKGLTDRVRSLLIQDRIEALSIPITAVNETSISLLKRLPQLKHVIILGAFRTDTASSPNLDLLTSALPKVKVYPSREHLGPRINVTAKADAGLMFDSVVPTAFENEL